MYVYFSILVRNSSFIHRIVRVLKSVKYEILFAEQISKLVEDHKKLITQSNIQTAQTVASISANVEQIAKQLKLLDTPRERDLQRFLGEHNGPEGCIENGDTLRKFIQKSGEGIEGVLGHQSEWNNKSESERMKEVQRVFRKEMAENVDEAFEKNFGRFKITLDLQGQRLTEIQKDTKTLLQRLNKGAHDYIVDTVSFIIDISSRIHF